MPGVKTEVIADKGTDKEIAVVVTRSIADIQRVARLLRCLGQQMGLQLCVEKVIRFALIDQYGQVVGCLTDQFAAVVLSPAVPVVSQVSTEGLFAPGEQTGANADTER